MLKCLFCLFLGEEEAKLHLHSEYETGPTDEGYGLGRRWVGLWDCSPGFLEWVNGEMDSEDHLGKLSCLGN